MKQMEFGKEQGFMSITDIKTAQRRAQSARVDRRPLVRLTAGPGPRLRDVKLLTASKLPFVSSSSLFNSVIIGRAGIW